MKPRAVAALAFAGALGWSGSALCLDDTQREQAVAATVERDAKKAALTQKTEALQNEKANIKASFTTTDILVGDVEKALSDPKGLQGTAKTTAATALQSLKGRVVPALGDGVSAADRNTAATAYQKAVTDAHSALEGVEADLKKATPPIDGVVKDLNAVVTKIAALVSRVADLEKQESEVATTSVASTAAEKAAEKALGELVQDTAPVNYLSARLAGARRVRCMLAYCFNGVDGSKYAVEPVLDLPVGLVWAAGSGALPSYINSHTVNVEFNAGLRFWLGYDIMSVMVYFSRPLIVGDDPIHVSGSAFPFPPSAVHRPFPSLGIGLAGDVLLLGVSYDELRNGSTDATRDPTYPANYVLSRSITFSLGFSLFNTAKNAVGAASSNGDKKESNP